MDIASYAKLVQMKATQCKTDPSFKVTYKSFSLNEIEFLFEKDLIQIILSIWKQNRKMNKP